MKKVQQGFTLIELMIVVAIIGILAAIAIPQYQDYVTRAKWAGAISSVESLKLGIAECAQNNSGDFSKCSTYATNGLPDAAPTMPTGATLGALTAATAAFTITGDASLKSCTITLTPSIPADGNNLSWGYAVGGGANCTKRTTGFGS